MFAITLTSSQVQDALARVALFVRRNLGDVEVVATDLAAKGKTPDMGVLRGEIVNFGSSWAALCMCVEVRPLDLPELLELAGVTALTGKRRQTAFDACADGYTVFHDGRRRRKL